MNFMEIFTLVTGVIYIVLEIRQKDFMWVVGIVTSLASMWVFYSQSLYASFALNTYYLITAFIGLWHWRRDRNKVMAGSEDAAQDDVLHLNHLTWKTVAVSAAVMVAGVPLLAWVMNMFENPMSWLDASVAVLSAVATWWLVRCYIEQWWLWIVANALSVALCLSQHMWWMAVLYAAYVLSAAYGLYHWKVKGRYI